MFHVKHSMKRIAAAAVGVVFCSTTAVSCFFFCPTQKALALDDDGIRNAFFDAWGQCLQVENDLLVDKDDSLEWKQTVFVVTCQAAYYYMHSASDIVYSDPESYPAFGDMYYFSGFCYYGGDTSRPYIGSGIIDAKHLFSRARLVYHYGKTDEDTSTIYCSVPGSDTSNISVSSGSSAGAGNTYYLSSWFDGYGRLYTTINGDPGYNSGRCYLFLGTDNSAPSYTGRSWGNYPGYIITFSSGLDTDVNTYLHDIPFTGNPSTDLPLLRDTLEDDYPDIVPEYWVEPQLQEPTTESTEDTTESGQDFQPFTLPPAWLREYEAPTETLPCFEVPTDTTLPEPNPSIQTIGLDFWADLWTVFVTRTGLLPYIGIIVGLSVLEFILWNLGGGKKGE